MGKTADQRQRFPKEYHDVTEKWVKKPEVKRVAVKSKS